MLTLALILLGALTDETPVTRGITRVLDPVYGVICYIGRTDKGELVSFWCMPVAQNNPPISVPSQGKK